jgi:hypothetical protein
MVQGRGASSSSLLGMSSIRFMFDRGATAAELPSGEVSLTCSSLPGLPSARTVTLLGTCGCGHGADAADTNGSIGHVRGDGRVRKRGSSGSRRSGFG